MRNFILIMLCGVSALAGPLTANGQDPQLSQYYAAPLYLNPAFTGNLDYDCRRLPGSRFRFIANYRNQAKGGYTDLMASLDYRSKNGNWGFGLLTYQDQQTQTSDQVNKLTTLSASFLASYKLSLSNDWRLHSGLSGGYNQRTASTGFIFPDQLNAAGPNHYGPTADTKAAGGVSVGAPDVTAGLLLFNSDFYIGTAVSHLNQPNLSMTGTTDKLAMKIDAHTGYRIGFKRERGFARRGLDRSITPAVHFKKQGNAQQLDVGSYFTYEPLILGAWFRGLPIEKAPDNSVQRDVAVILVGVRQPTDVGVFKIGLSYDFPLSTGATNFGRTFELSVSYQLINERCRKRVTYRAIPCPSI